MLPILGALPALLAPAAVAFLVFENDSADDTAAKLISWIGGDARRAATARLHFARRLGGSRSAATRCSARRTGSRRGIC